MQGVHLDSDYRYAVRAYHLDGSGRRQGLTPETAASALVESGTMQRVRAVRGDAQTDFMVNRVDKGIGLRSLIDQLGADKRGAGSKSLALAVGDTESDLPMFPLARLAAAPAHANLGVRAAGVLIMKRPYQAGLALAVARLLGHRPGGCAICRTPRLPADTRRLMSLLGTREDGAWGMLRAALWLTIAAGS
jgi:hypothetical protein